MGDATNFNEIYSICVYNEEETWKWCRRAGDHVESESIVMEKGRSQKLLRNMGADNGELEKA